MKTLKEFIQDLEHLGDNKNSVPALENQSKLSEQMLTLKSSSTNEIQNLILATPFGIENKEKIIPEKIEDLTEFSFSDNFVDKINTEVGEPKENESKEEYVKRGLELVKKLLKEKLK